MSDDEPTTDVIFRVWQKNGDVIALFPGIAGDASASTCACYQHVGQHGAVNIFDLAADTRPATPQEYDALKHELESAPFGYRFRVIQRASRKHLDERRAQLSTKGN